jgi:hypothetical protein
VRRHLACGCVVAAVCVCVCVCACVCLGGRGVLGGKREWCVRQFVFRLEFSCSGCCPA